MTDMHIKMPDVTPLVRYTANGSQAVFSFPFPIFASADIRILFDGVEQVSGFDVSGTGDTNGGVVTFDAAPNSGTVITIYRDVPFERYTDFLEGGDFSARALNNELDYLTASIQQLSRDQGAMVRYPQGEAPSSYDLPDKSIRAGRALGFDANGNPVAMDAALVQATPNFTANGVGAVTRGNNDKHTDIVSVKDFGAIGDGVADDTLAFGKALGAHHAVFMPEGAYRITDTIEIGFGKRLYGAGQSSVIQCDDNLFTAIQVRNGYNTLSDFVIDGGDVGLRLCGLDGPCVQNRITNLVIRNSDVGIELDGGNDTGKPTYWNMISNTLILSPLETGILLTKSGAGDTPNANIFDACRIYSQGIALANHGIHVQHGSFYNRFVNCEVNVDGTAQSCVTIGAGANETILDNLYCESFNGVPNVVLASGSQKTLLTNLLATGDGAAIDDQSGGDYQAINAGFPTNNRLDKAQVNDITATLLRQDTVYIEDAGVASYPLNTARSVHLISAFNGEITIDLPLASTVPAATYLIKKVDFTGNAVVVSEPNGLGIDRKSEIILGGPYDYVAIISNGAEWHITSSNRMAGNTQFHETSGTLDIDMAVDTYLVSSFAGAVTCRLPPANAAKAIGRTITIKKTDPSSNAVNITEQGGAGPDNNTQTLAGRYNAITVVSNGAAWHIISKY